MSTPKKPAFPWSFLSEPEGANAENAAVWIFLHLQSKAWRGFLESGRGVLVGPFLSDEEDEPITTEEAIRRRANQQMVGIAVMYLPALSPEFAEMVPVESVRETIWYALERYNPESQSVVLLRHDETAISVSIVGVDEESDGPRARPAPAGLPN